MNSYGGGYNTGGDGGGFMYGASQQGSQSTSKNYADESLRPLTIKQVLDAEETYPSSGEFRIDGHQVSQITIVGQVRQVTAQQTNIQYKIDDGTGIVECKKYVDTDRAESENDPSLDVDAFVRIHGRLKAFSSKRYVGINFIRGIKDFNEVNHHMLEATAVHLYFTKGPLGGGGGGQQQQEGAGGDGMFVDGAGYNGGMGAGGGASKLVNATPAAQKLFNFMHNAPGGNEGVHLNVLASGSGMSVREVIAAADELLGQGVIYTTVDDETWAVLDY